MTLQNKSIDDIEKLYKQIVCNNNDEWYEDDINEIIEEANNETEYRNELIKGIQGWITTAYNYKGDINDYDQICSFMTSLITNSSHKTHYQEMLKRYNDEFDNEIESYETLAEQEYNEHNEVEQQRQIRYNEYLEREHQKELESQRPIVDEIMQDLERTPTNWSINFERLTDNGRLLLLPLLKTFFEEHIETLPQIGRYKISFKVNGVWYHKPLDANILRQLMDNLTKNHFIFDIEHTNPEYFYEKGAEKIPEWSVFSEIKFSLYMKGVKANNDVGGSFFQYLVDEKIDEQIKEYLKRLQIFDSLVNDKNKQREELTDCCFIYALSQTGSYDEDTLNKMRLRINSRYLSQSSINKICYEFKIHLKLSFINEESSTKNKKKTVRSTKNNKSKSFLGIDNAEPNRTHTMNVYNNHYFIEEQTPFSTYYIKHLNECPSDKFNKEYKTDHWINARAFMKSSDLVRELMKQNYFKPITFGQYKILNTTFFNDINKDIELIDLNYDEDTCTQLIAPPQQKKNNKENTMDEITYWYADFEADTSGDIHKPFMVVLQSENGKINKEYRGVNCNEQLLEYLPNNAVVYFHNLAYDMRMMASYGINKSIIKGNKVMTADIEYKKKTIHFKDTLPILSCKLSSLPKMFNIPNIQKEIFPYKYYTLERLNDGAIGTINEAGINEDKKWKPTDYTLFESNIDKIKGCRIDENHFDMWSYCSFYCQQDVNILRLGFNAFRAGFIKDFKIDPFKFISISSLANEVFNQRVYYPNRNLFKLGGHVRYFCQKAVYGGRCMTAYNKKWHTYKPISDFDAVSLYPSAMARLYTVEGRPKVITADKLNYDFLSKQSAYVVEIEITKINKHYAFPLIVRRVNGLNLNDDNLEEGQTIKMVVDNITLEDFIEFQQIEFKLIRGYYWDGKRDYRIQKAIRDIFNKRLEYKKQNNPLQNLYKLIMNSTYGKTIERPVEKDYKYLHSGDELDKFWTKNYNKIIEDVELFGCDIHAVKTLKQINNHFNFSLLGIQILSMSKRIMNEVMCLAFDIGCHIYYQDSDSVHIECDDLPKLVDAFKEKYNRDLIGSNLGQFHSDFPTVNGHQEMPKAIESIFLMKKMYVDKLQDSTGEVDYMIRGKGLTQESIKYVYNEKFNGDVMKLYESIFNGESQTFDLAKGQPCFEMNKNMTVSTKEQFKRKIKTTYEEGNRDEYFKYANN